MAHLKGLRSLEVDDLREMCTKTDRRKKSSPRLTTVDWSGVLEAVLQHVEAGRLPLFVADIDATPMGRNRIVRLRLSHLTPVTVSAEDVAER